MYKQAMETGESFDIVIMDLTIPGGMGGKEAVTEILTIDPEAKVIVFSGYSTDAIMANYSEYGFRGRLSKPFKIVDLIKEITRIMETG
ncbi:MAG: response regulator [Candidatus Hatepunaea meridiana]|nr:response regulator [Candidatus Hatepunaea meridiana]